MQRNADVELERHEHFASATAGDRIKAQQTVPLFNRQRIRRSAFVASSRGATRYMSKPVHFAFSLSLRVQ